MLIISIMLISLNGTYELLRTLMGYEQKNNLIAHENYEFIIICHLYVNYASLPLFAIIFPATSYSVLYAAICLLESVGYEQLVPAFTVAENMFHWPEQRSLKMQKCRSRIFH